MRWSEIKTILTWCHEIKNEWNSEFKEGKEPEEIKNEKIDFTSFISLPQIRKIHLYDP